MVEKEIYLFDIDRTLFDADAFEHMLYQRISGETGLSIEEINALRLEYRAKLSGYPMNGLIDYISQKSGVSLEQLQEDLKDKSIYKKFLFDDVESNLDRLIKEGKLLGIFSSGNYDDQTMKISDIIDFFRNDLIFINGNKLESEFLEKIPDEATIIDDRQDVIQGLHSSGRVDLFWLNRSGGENLNPNEAIMIRSLKDLP